MKISDLIAYLQKYQEEFGDVDVELNLDGAKIGPDGKVPTKAPTPTEPAGGAVPKYVPMFGGSPTAPVPITLDTVLKNPSKFYKGMKELSNNPWDLWLKPYYIPRKENKKKTFSLREAKGELEKRSSPIIDNIINKYFNYPSVKP